jgi:hypothetical protein
MKESARMRTRIAGEDATDGVRLDSARCGMAVGIGFLPLR